MSDKLTGAQLDKRAEEEWRPVVGWKGIYEVSSEGRVRNALARSGSKVGRLRKLRPDQRGGYLHVLLKRQGRLKLCYVHVLVAEAFIGPRKKGVEVDHIDGVRTNNARHNLQYVTHAENVRLAAVQGAYAGRRPQAKITAKDVVRIRKMWKRGRTNREIGVAFKLGYKAVSDVVHRRSWEGVK